MTISSPGIGSNLDVNTIVSKLMQVEQQPLNVLNSKEAGYQAKLSAFGSIKGAISSFQGALLGLSDISRFQALSASSSDSTSVSASASAISVPGSYAIDVTTLAQSQKLVASGQTTTTAAIGSGTATTLTFDFGTISGGTFNASTGKYSGAAYTSNGSGTKTVTIDASNNSLQGIRDAINSAGIGVTATIINDGSTTPYRLALASSAIGSSNSLKISVAGDASVSALLAQDPAATQNMTETVSAQNANFKVNGVSVSKASNSISDVIQGVTLNLQKITTSTVNLTVSRDTTTVQTSINTFVKGYNDLNSTLKKLSAYDPATKQGAILQGDTTVRTLQSQLRRMLDTPVKNISGTLTNLSQIGVSFQKDGSLAVDSSKLSNTFTNNFSDIAALFTSVGKASDSLVSFVSATSSTKPGNYAVTVSSLPTQGSTAGNFNLNAGLNTIAAGTTVNVTLDGNTASVALAAGTTYTSTQLAAVIQSAINGNATFVSAGSSVAATVDGSGFLHITSKRYGSASNVSLASATGTLVTDFMGTSSNQAGNDVAGTINGQAATGSGQNLTAAPGLASGMQIQILGGTLGSRGTVNYSQGYANNLYTLTSALLGSDGPLTGVTKGINSTITDLSKQRDVINRRLISIEARYRKQFTSLDTMISSMNTTSTYLTQQLAQLAKL